MKPSHRKDVIIARIIFAFICIALIAIIVSVVMLISSHTKKKENPKETEIQTERESESEDIYEDIPFVTPDQNEAQQKDIVKTTSSVNLRANADKDSDVLIVVPEGIELLVFSEENGWAQVEYAGYSGYVFAEYIQRVESGQEAETENNDSVTEGE